MNADGYFNHLTQWREESEALRAIILQCPVSETLKWGKPCYRSEGNNILLIHGFKHYCALLFMKGALLGDEKHLLIAQTANVQSARQLRFTSTAEIAKLKTTIKAYIKQAIALEQSGEKVAFKKNSEFAMPEEFRRQLDANPKLKTAFSTLTPGRQRGYLLYFAGAKQQRRGRQEWRSM